MHLSFSELPELAGYPPFVANWLAKRAGATKGSCTEYRLWSDSRFVGHLCDPEWPVQFLNPVPNPRTQGSTTAIYVRFDLYVSSLKSDLFKTDVSAYHGGTIIDEVAALCSLALGVRIWAGSLSRIFGQDTDPLGRPVEFEFSEPRQVGNETHGNRVLPDVVGDQVNINNLRILSSASNVNADTAIALIRAARLYQEALWLAESAPELSWLLFVSAIEVAAGNWSNVSDLPHERLEAARPELAKELMRVGGQAHLEAVANIISESLGSTKKFTEFVSNFALKESHEPLDKVKKDMQKIYSYRSKALHSGVPFPAPMCSPPFLALGQNKPYWKVPIGLAASKNGGVWTAVDMPMNLHGFHEIVRGCLLNWWKSLSPQSE